MKKLTLTKSERLKSRKQIDLLFQEGKNFRVGPVKVIYRLEQAGIEALQFGVTAPSRNFKRAVDRNRIKRLMREAWRLNCTELKTELQHKSKYLVVFFIFSGRELPNFNEIEEKTIKAIGNLREIVVSC
ncbi:MAG: ribonuclease P protein component [Chitinophagaceae bacterium]|nr:ribonuclease P protein component [Chitinophagaceae bacterium]